MRVEKNKAFAYRVPIGDYNYLQCRKDLPFLELGPSFLLGHAKIGFYQSFIKMQGLNRNKLWLKYKEFHDLCEMRIFLDFRRYVSIWENLHGSVKICKDLQGSARICKDLQGSARICKDMQGSARICKDLTGSLRLCKDLRWSVRFYICS